MKATLEFALPDDMYAFKCASIAQDLAHAVIEINRIYRNYSKHREDHNDPRDVIQEMHDAVRELAWRLEQG